MAPAMAGSRGLALTRIQACKVAGTGLEHDTGRKPTGFASGSEPPGHHGPDPAGYSQGYPIRSRVECIYHSPRGCACAEILWSVPGPTEWPSTAALRARLYGWFGGQKKPDTSRWAWRRAAGELPATRERILDQT